MKTRTNKLATFKKKSTINRDKWSFISLLKTLSCLRPNVCRSRHDSRTHCCPGWTIKVSTGLCTVPICSRSCGTGRCIKPNMCLCEGGTLGFTCKRPSPDVRNRGGTNGTRQGNQTHPNGVVSGIGPGQSHRKPDRNETAPCRTFCLNGGTCQDTKCICPPGFSGEHCSEPICRESCLNGGRCIGHDRCACPYGYTGRRCEADYRTGPCYTIVKNDMCLGQLEGIVCTKNLCCATVGKAWGHPCEQCPTTLECEQGYLKNIHSQECLDVDECEAIPGLCAGGRCLNTIGSFTCECPEGQARRLTTNRCEDRDECLIPNVCLDGRCVNTNGSYYCVCNPGFIPSQDRKTCIDARQGNCYTSLSSTGQCQGQLGIKLSKKDCCCGVNMGRGWGNECDICPMPGEEEFKRLCLEVPVVVAANGTSSGTQDPYPINECALRPTICGGGKCIDTAQGYDCECFPGYVLGNSQICEDIDECSDLGYCQGGGCLNTPGSFQCTCPVGFDVSSDGRFCIDHDECQQTGMCANGICLNMNGSFKCKCHKGFVLSPTGHSCIDIDECYENPRICLNGRCQNVPGSHKCICLPGFTLSEDGTFCLDKDECADTGMCTNGKCVNVDGSFTCVCDSGFRLAPDRRKCVDIDECASNPCQHGTCTNTQGNFQCTCSQGFNLGPDGRSCIDNSRDLCYSQFKDGLCSNPMSNPVTKSSCCCSGSHYQVFGWGTPCRPCPVFGSLDYQQLCPHGPGMTYNGVDINECAQNPNICENGACENILGGYRCVCNPGYQIDVTGKICQEINECEIEGQVCGGGQCKNTPGSFQCICPLGLELNPQSQICEDVDECEKLGTEACLNGQCVNTIASYECHCPPGSVLDNTGRICIDNQKGSCWTRMVGGQCENNLPRPTLKSECCCSVGVAWGSPCERCNSNACDCPKGYAKVDGKTCTDINECDINPGICRGGGTCVNTEGSFTCVCPRGLILDSSGTLCLDARTEDCYTDFKNGIGLNPIEGKYSKAMCCCTSIGKAWGQPQVEPCPRPGTAAHRELCPRGPGFIDRKDVNECTQFPKICENGRCKNTIGGYSCRCNQGYVLDENGIKCIDIDECGILHGVCGHGTCRNIPGSFVCDCNPGFENTMMMQVCMDINECERTPGLCRGGRCINTEGSFKCHCPPGHELAPDQQSCKDIDECSRSSGICSNGVCENMMGTYQCVCNDGYQQADLKSHCEDVNECDVRNGGCEDICVNTPGSYTCSCRTGYTLLLDGRSCVDMDECKMNRRICNGGNCTNTPGSYTCLCRDGLLPGPDSTSCIDVNECEIEPNLCGNGQCENILGSYVCRCEDGYTVSPGRTGCHDVDECEVGTHTCDPNAHCINNPGSYECACLDGFTGNGINCRDINECLTNNGGCDENAQCINMIGSFKCECDSGFKGDGYTCQDIDECTNDITLCENGHCLNYPGSFRCECEMGFMHPDDKNDQSCRDINECEMFSNLCLHGKCENIFGMFRCECNEGYQVDNTGGNCTDIDECESPQACLYGSCINTQGSFHCQCPPNYELVPSGNGCVDLRTSRCYLQVEEKSGRNRCLKEMGEPVNKATCCCSVGKGWGPRCELCPQPDTEEYRQLCPGGTGYRPNPDTVVLEDINECLEHKNLCTNGHCVNTFGSFMCSCNDGFRLDAVKAICVDINECQEMPDICGVGFCINDDGSYHCVCPDGFMLLPNGKECLDTRKENCYMQYNEEGCTHPMSHEQTRMVCCCSMGAAWGSPCKPCPKPGTREYVWLCGTRPGQIVNPMTNQTEEIDECVLMPTMCNHGTCLNTPGSFECLCDRGFVYEEDSHQCIDDNECLRTPSPCRGNAQCVNFPGNFECHCPEGYKLDTSMRGCTDVDECTEKSQICQNGECNNFQGSFQCVCLQGYQLTPFRDNCVDVDECQRHPNTCNNGTCMNSIGSYSCHCYPGFKLSPNNDCIDIDECRTMPFLCRNGRCRNTIGSFTCDCVDGYTMTSDGMNCRDVDECIENIGRCPPPGKCQNLMGSYTCLCPLGYKSTNNGTACVDVDECSEMEGTCEDGTCINTEGSFKCECPDGFILSTNGMKCIDIRKDHCYDHFYRGICDSQRMEPITVKECCCSMGKAWGRNCEQCPPEGSDAFRKLCPQGPGRGDTGGDINECEFMPDVCENGDCVNTDGSFRCECQPGFVLDPTGKRCIDDNECVSNVNICGNGTCTNIKGSFECSCNEGYSPGPFQTCEDINECKEMGLGNQCAFRCHNVPGSFRCICPYGYALAPDGMHCQDVDECATPANNCRYACKNLIGSFMCVCPDGYQQIGVTDECKDIDECSLNSRLCANGHCINLEGGYRCECLPGFVPNAGSTECLDKREGKCHRQLVAGRCPSSTERFAPVTKADCCCSMGTAWGPQCELCPKKGTNEFDELCLESGFSIDGQDIDECLAIPNLCKNGRCTNTLGSYKCICNKGYQVDSTGTLCKDINECNQFPLPCQFTCSNTEGSFTCSCPFGYILNSDGTSCRDINECMTGQHVCTHECINTPGSYYCGCPKGFNQSDDRCLDINECEVPNTCPPPGHCINTIGSFNCICPRGFKLDSTKTRCIDQDECTDDNKCHHSCKNSVGGYKCGCPEGYVPHHYYNQCLDENECLSSPCGEAGCINTLGSYKCGCPQGFQFDGGSQLCIQVSLSCLGSPCVFGCIQDGSNGPLCSCPNGYRTIGQGHCLSTINPMNGFPHNGLQGYGVGQQPLYITGQLTDSSGKSDKKYLSTEGCFTCRVGAGRNRRSVKVVNGKKIFGPLVTLNSTAWHQKPYKKMKNRKLKKIKRHYNLTNEYLILRVSLSQTKHKMRIIKIQPAVKVHAKLKVDDKRAQGILQNQLQKNFQYKIKKGNENNQFEMIRKHGIWALHFRKRLKSPENFNLEIEGHTQEPENEVWEKPLTLRVHLQVT
ncbi:hypothetical protein RUM44_005957 [Polyplax serrata]|uniref:Fibrillin-2 n=1 Tax=Polyplax serrata TaxID=468196 RepID=A0ABR1AYM2_POLSC